jgi:protein involved in polysaccharide export with SLBB domain
MATGRVRWSWRLAAAVLTGLTGCAGTYRLPQALLADRTPAAHQADPTSLYHIRCPDVLQLTVAGRPDWTGLRPVETDGRVHFGGSAEVEVDGLTPAEAAERLAAAAGVRPADARVQVAEFRSQELFLISPAASIPGVLPYRGPETVIDLLQRAGGLPADAAPNDVQVVRSHIVDGTAPEVFHVDLDAIINRHDQQTNVSLEPLDQIYIGQTRSAGLAPCLPPWLRRLLGGGSTGR